DSAARHLGWSLRTLERRLARGRDLLRARLARRGLTLSAAGLAALLTQSAANAATPARLVASLARAAGAFAAGAGTPAGVSVRAVTLAKGTFQYMVVSKFNIT